MLRRVFGPGTCLGLLLIFGASIAQAQYQVTNLDSNQGSVVKNPDPLLVNGWGITRGATTPFWVSDNGSGWSTIYNGAGKKQPLEVSIPTAGGNGPGSPTGIVFNGSSDFQIQGAPAVFLFATLDGTISGWAPSVNLNSAIIAAKNSGSVYTGLAITSNASGNFLFAVDNANAQVDVYDATFQWVKSFTDTTIPAGFAPFGIQDFGGVLYVTFAATNGGPGGFVDLFAEDGTFLKQVATGAPLNQPWGVAIAPRNFGSLSNTLLVSNNTNGGTINAFNAITGQFVGTVKDTSGKPIVINQLWGIMFGGGASSNGALNELYFTAGPENNKAGLFGVIRLAPTATSD
jgi:uncharacterized protein (TIGR03118 family)